MPMPFVTSTQVGKSSLKFFGCHAHRFGWACRFSMPTQSRGHGTRKTHCQKAFAYLLGLAVVLVSSTAVFAAVPKHIDDAPLRGVQFIDGNEGWAVGDDGVVWHTIDGGES